MSGAVIDAEVKIREPSNRELCPPELTFRWGRQTRNRRTEQYVTYMISDVKRLQAGKRNRGLEGG